MCLSEAYQAFYTFFEITLSGSWPAKVRPVLLKVSPALFGFFALYLGSWLKDVTVNDLTRLRYITIIATWHDLGTQTSAVE